MDDEWADIDFSNFAAEKLDGREFLSRAEESRDRRQLDIDKGEASVLDYKYKAAMIDLDRSKLSDNPVSGRDNNPLIRRLGSSKSAPDKVPEVLTNGQSTNSAVDRRPKRSDPSCAATNADNSSGNAGVQNRSRPENIHLRSFQTSRLDQRQLLSQYCETREDDCFDSLSTMTLKDVPRNDLSEVKTLRDRLRIQKELHSRRPLPAASRIDTVTAWQQSQALSTADELEGLCVPEGTTLKLLLNKSGGPATASVFESDNEEWAESSLGIRHAASRHTRSARASTGSSSLSISISSAAGTDHELEGLELPEDLLTLQERFKLTKEKRSAGDTIKVPSRRLAQENFLDDLILDQDTFIKAPSLRHQTPKQAMPQRLKSELTASNVVYQRPSRLPKPDNRIRQALTFQETSSFRPTEHRTHQSESPSNVRSPNPVPPKIGNKPSLSSLRSVSGAPSKEGHTQASIARASPRLLKSPQARPAFLPGGSSAISSHHVSALGNRNDTSIGRPKTPSYRTISPNKRRVTASEALKQEAAKYCTLTHVRAKTYGEGHELDELDDLPTSISLERRLQQPSPSKLPSRSSVDTLERYREKRHAASEARTKDPTSSLKALRHPTHVPTSRLPNTIHDNKAILKKKRKVMPPGLISGVNTTAVPKVEKNMVYNPRTFIWEGNEDDEMDRFDTTINSPPRPALISNVNGTKKGVQVVNGMVFDPDQMCWVKLTDEDSDTDPFEGLDDTSDLLREKDALAGSVGSHQISLGEFLVGEEFDAGPVFIRRQREEETRWRVHTLGWIRYQSDRRRRAYLHDIYDLLMDD